MPCCHTVTECMRYWISVVEMVNGQFSVPPPKFDGLQALLQQLQQRWDVSTFRTAAGTLAAMAPGLRLAPMLSSLWQLASMSAPELQQLCQL